MNNRPLTLESIHLDTRELSRKDEESYYTILCSAANGVLLTCPKIASARIVDQLEQDCRSYINENGISADQWVGGSVFSSGKLIGTISFKGLFSETCDK